MDKEKREYTLLDPFVQKAIGATACAAAILVFFDIYMIWYRYHYPEVLLNSQGPHAILGLLDILRWVPGALLLLAAVIGFSICLVSPVIYLPITGRQFLHRRGLLKKGPGHAALDEQRRVFRFLPIGVLLAAIGGGQAVTMVVARSPERDDSVADNINAAVATIDWTAFSVGPDITHITGNIGSMSHVADGFALLDQNHTVDIDHWWMIPGRLRATDGESVRFVIIDSGVSFDSEGSPGYWVRRHASGGTVRIRAIRMPTYEFRLYDRRRHEVYRTTISGYYRGMDVIGLNNFTSLDEAGIDKWELDNARLDYEPLLRWLGMVD